MYREQKLRIMLLIMIFSFISTKLLVSQQVTKCLAVITEINGDVLFKKANKSEFVKTFWGAQLYQGDQVKTSKKSGVSLLFSNGNLIDLESNSMITISKKHSSENETKESFKNIESELIADFSILTLRRDDKGEIGALVGLRTVYIDRQVVLLSPYNTLINTNLPSFSWFSKKSFDNFNVKLYNSNGLLWSKEISENKMEYPGDEEELEYGESYFWHVEGEDLIDTYKSVNQGFSILSQEKSIEVGAQEKRIKDLFRDDPNSCSFHSVLGFYYIKKGLLEDAIKEFKMISEINANAPLPHEILGKLYNDTGKKDMAIAELQKALQLSKNGK